MTSAGDLGRSVGLSHAYARTKLQLDTLTRESASGLRSDVAAAAGGDIRPLAGMDNRLRRLDAYDQSAAEMALHLDTAQEALGGMQAVMKGTGIVLLGAQDRSLDAVLASADSNLEAAIGFINAESAGRFAFGGTRPDAPAVIGRDALMAQIDTVVAGLTTADAITAAVATFFGAPPGAGGYMDVALRGSQGTGGAVAVGTAAAAEQPLTAADPALRDMLKGLTLAALAKRGVPGGDDGQRAQLTRSAGQAILAAETRVIAAGARVGVVQEQVEVARVRNGAERSALQIARNNVVAVDPYETATALTDAQGRLETLYALTARLSRMSLADRL